MSPAPDPYEEDILAYARRNRGLYVSPHRGLVAGVVEPFDAGMAGDLSEREFYAVIHKGEVADAPLALMSLLAGRSEAVHANDVFIVFRAADISGADNSRKSFYKNIAAAPASRAAAEAGSAAGGGLYMGRDTILARTVFGRKIFLDSTDISLTPHIATDGTWEPWITAFFRRTLRPGQTFFDLGANCGFYSLLAADAVGPTGSVLAVEPQPKLADLIRKSFSVNGFSDFSRVAQYGIGEARARLDLHMKKDLSGDASLMPLGADTAHTETIDVLPLPDLVSRMEADFGRKLVPSVIKVDIEGFEIAFWKGAKAFLSSLSPLTMVLEFFPARYIALGEDPAAFAADLADAGFAVTRLKPDGEEIPFRAGDVSALIEAGGFADLILRR